MSFVNVDDKSLVWWKPARKVFINQLKLLSKTESNKQYDTYQIKFQNQNIEVVQVWIQGTVTAKGNDRIIMEDGTGSVTITNVDKVPGDCDWLKKGMYIHVIGNIKSAQKIEAEQIKQCSIKDINLAKELWKMEVKDLWNYLVSTIKS